MTLCLNWLCFDKWQNICKTDTILSKLFYERKESLSIDWVKLVQAIAMIAISFTSTYTSTYIYAIWIHLPNWAAKQLLNWIPLNPQFRILAGFSSSIAVARKWSCMIKKSVEDSHDSWWFTIQHFFLPNPWLGFRNHFRKMVYGIW